MWAFWDGDEPGNQLSRASLDLHGGGRGSDVPLDFPPHLPGSDFISIVRVGAAMLFSGVLIGMNTGLVRSQ